MNSRPVSGKKVVVFSLLFFVVFSILMGFGSFAFAQWLAPILRERNESSQPKQPVSDLKK
ncbi:MAG TPA: hypothetical protein VK934_07895 [Fimbriimonas sp.]|nr:hypothetical protein [Fimbriimonas sp.]